VSRIVTVRDLVQRVAAFGLPQQDDLITAAPMHDVDWRWFVGRIEQERLAGFLHAAIESGALPVTDEQRTQADDLHLAACATALRLDRQLLQVAAVLESAEVRFIVLKGTAAAHLTYPDPSLRMYGDIDLLVGSDRFDDALARLFDEGFERPAAAPTRWFDRRFGKGATLRGAGGLEVDLHRTLVFGSFGLLIDLEQLHDSTTAFEFGDVRFLALDAEARLLHACYHAALGDPIPRFGSVRDVAQLALVGPVDERRVLELVEAWQAEAVVQRALRLCRDHLGVTVSGTIAAALADYQPSRRERRAIASYVGPNRGFAAKVFASLPFVRGVGAKAAFLAAIAFPSARFVETRGGEPGFAWLRRGVRSLRGGRL
jgi:hypothetical protein